MRWLITDKSWPFSLKVLWSVIFYVNKFSEKVYLPQVTFSISFLLSSNKRRTLKKQRLKKYFEIQFFFFFYLIDQIYSFCIFILINKILVTCSECKDLIYGCQNLAKINFSPEFFSLLWKKNSFLIKEKKIHP